MHFTIHTGRRGRSGASLERDAAGFVKRIIDGERYAVEELYGMLHVVVQQHMRHRLPSQDPEDVLHEMLATVIEALRRGELRRPEALAAYLHSVVRRQVATKILRVVRHRNRTVECTDRVDIGSLGEDPEGACLRREQLAIIGQGLSRLEDREAELLRRFYLHGEELADICEQMRLTPTQFRLFKSRAKAKLLTWARRVAKVA